MEIGGGGGQGPSIVLIFNKSLFKLFLLFFQNGSVIFKFYCRYNRTPTN